MTILLNILQENQDLKTLIEVLGSKHEHTAIHYENESDLDKVISTYTGDGFLLKHKNHPVAFLQRDEIRLELIPTSIPQHEAWASKTVKDFKILKKFLDEHNNFEELPKFTQMLSNINSVIYRVKNTGDHIQIIWRVGQIFTEVL